MRRILAVLTAVLLGLLASAGQAAASDPGGAAEQAAANAAASAQSALALAGALQGSPSNDNIAVRVLSPGDAGSVSQSNTVIAGSVAANGNSTSQTANQSQAGGPGTQTTGQVATNDQSAASSADAEQVGASNENIDVRVLSPGDGGSVAQSNTVLAGSLAANKNQATQSSNQSQAGGPGSGYGQTVGQAASNKQSADAAATASQKGAKNKNISVRVLSPGKDGSMEQSNTVAGIAAALNGNSTNQTASQTQAGGPTGGGTQATLQGASSDQWAASDADARQYGASNENIGVRVLSPGDGGSVSQSNTAIAGSLALNANETSQTASQSQAGGYGTGQQVAGQVAKNDQSALADSTAFQHGASNTNIPIRIGSYGDDGAVSQSNTVVGIAAALNGNQTTQTAAQTQGGSGSPLPVLMPVPYPEKKPYPEKEAGTGVQVIGQLAESRQDADAVSTAAQADVANVNAPVWLGSDGDGGSTSQSNTALSGAIAANKNETTQAASQSQSGPGTLVQAVGQAALNKQDACACATALQLGAKNTNAPVRLFSDGDDGSLTQSNKAAAIAAALNGNGTGQSAGQTQAGGGGSPLVQAVGQAAANEQAAAGDSDASQLGASNTSTPFRFGGDLGKHCEPRKDPCESKRPVEPPMCEAGKPDYDRCKPDEPDYDSCKPDYDRCRPSKPGYDRCEPRKDTCEKRPVELPSCEKRKPDCERCEPCERPKRKYCPDRRCLQAK